MAGEDRLGEFGQIKTEYRIKNEVESEIYLAIFDFATLAKHSKIMGTYKSINPFATVKLDLTIEENAELNYQKIRTIMEKSSQALTKIEFLDKYNNNITLRLYFSLTNRNITEDEAKEELAKINNYLGLASRKLDA